jgi:hypothetical protein
VEVPTVRVNEVLGLMFWLVGSVTGVAELLIALE